MGRKKWIVFKQLPKADRSKECIYRSKYHTLSPGSNPHHWEHLLRNRKMLRMPIVAGKFTAFSPAQIMYDGKKNSWNTTAGSVICHLHSLNICFVQIHKVT